MAATAAVTRQATTWGNSRCRSVRCTSILAQMLLFVVVISSALLVFHKGFPYQNEPFLSKPIQPIINLNRVLKQNLRVTSALHSTYSLTNRELHVGDTAHFIIQAKDAEGRNQVTGGDFWFPVLTTDVGAYPAKGGRTAGKVVDHKNGSYSVFFYAGWEGTAYVHVKLAASSKATKWLQQKYWPHEKRVFWEGEFSSNIASERTLCYLLRNVTSPNLCRIDYNPTAMGLTVFYCEKPRILSCNDIQAVYLNPKLIDERTTQLLSDDKELFDNKHFLAVVTHGPASVAISETNFVNQSKAPICKPADQRLVNDGFWLNDNWHNLQCKVRRWDDVRAVKNCLRHKHVFIHGDSNVRIWYSVLMKKMGLPWEHLGKGTTAFIMHDYLKTDDIEMSFYFHPRVVTKRKLTLKTTRYEVDVLDNIPSVSCGKYIIVLCPWGHFTQWTTESYAERTQLLKEAVVRFRERCPDVPIVIKGVHPREHGSLLGRVYASDYTIWKLGVILRNTFRGTGVFYYDVWQMNLAYGTQNIHMPLPVINEEINWFLSYVCK
ncbi:NXPE family member 4-like [Asterias rubens]|uniref:NXPE family member 4-like n=1 Tax=Asterias rubens TaxID=7604 RepID=UPI001454F2F5|nr:NXPE family member 4-like [Asterias rubens]